MELDLNPLFKWFQIFAELPLHQEVGEQVFAAHSLYFKVDLCKKSI